MYDIAIGDEIIAIGLYTSHYGLEKNIPVLRVGNLAMLRSEPVLGPQNRYFDAYLVEIRSIAGLSGSPVLINPPAIAVRDGQLQFRKGDMYIQLGVLIGYHVMASQEDQVSVPQLQARLVPLGDSMDSEKKSLDERMTGFSVVIPIGRVLEIIGRSDIQAEIKNKIGQHK